MIALSTTLDLTTLTYMSLVYVLCISFDDCPDSENFVCAMTIKTWNLSLGRRAREITLMLQSHASKRDHSCRG